MDVAARRLAPYFMRIGGGQYVVRKFLGYEQKIVDMETDIEYAKRLADRTDMPKDDYHCNILKKDTNDDMIDKHTTLLWAEKETRKACGHLVEAGKDMVFGE
jgi:hypothetical protein